jgi:hypothetical protein
MIDIAAMKGLQANYSGVITLCELSKVDSRILLQMGKRKQPNNNMLDVFVEFHKRLHSQCLRSM